MHNSVFEDMWGRRSARILLRALALLVLTLPFARPFLLGQHPTSGDGLINLYRVVALDYAIQHGDLWPRYLTAMHYGYGGPNFNFYSPLSLYLIEGVHLLGFALPLAYRLSIILFGLLAGGGAYVLGRRWQGEPAGWVTAAAYLYAPMFFSTFDRPAQMLAVALLPWLIWAAERAIDLRRAADMALLALLFGALILTHNITALYAGPMIAVYSAHQIAQAEDRGAALLAFAVPVLAGMCLTAFFWLPALMERDFVQLYRLDIPQFDFRMHFLPLTQIFPLELPRAISFGWPQLALGGVAIAAAVKGRARSPVAFSVVMIAALVFLTTRSSLWIWEHVPLVNLILFPQRLLFGAGLWLALVAGSGAVWVADRLSRPLLRTLWLVAVIAGLIAYAQPTSTTAYLDMEPATESILALHDFERNTGWLGATSTGEFLPIWVEDELDVWALVDRFRKTDVIPRLRDNTEVRVLSETWDRKQVDLTIEAARATTLEFDWLYFPGWAGELDGLPVDIRPGQGHGMVSMDVPEGNHHIALGFGPTPVRRRAETLSGVGLFVFGVWLIWWHDRGRRRRKASTTDPSH